MHSTQLRPRRSHHRRHLWVIGLMLLIATLTPSLAAHPHGGTPRNQPGPSAQTRAPIRTAVTAAGDVVPHDPMPPNMPRFWDGPLQSSTTLRMGDSELVRPGPDERVHLI